MPLGSKERTALIGSVVVAIAALGWIGWPLGPSDGPRAIEDIVDSGGQTQASDSMLEPIAAAGGTSLADPGRRSGVRESSRIQIHYDARINQVTLAIEDAPLSLVLSRLAAVTRMAVEISSGLEISERVTIAEKKLTPLQALDLLLAGFRSAHVYHKDWVLGDGPDIARVVVTGRVTDGSSEARR